MITNTFKEDIAILIEDNISYGKVGTDNTTPTVNDTDLVAGNVSTQFSVSSVQTGRQVLVTYNLSSVHGNGNTYKEYGNFLTNDDMVNRVIFTEIPKTESIEIQVSTLIEVV